MKFRTFVGVMLLCLAWVTLIDDGFAQTLSRTENAALRYWMAFAQMQDPAADQDTTNLLDSVASGKQPWDENGLGPILDANRLAIETLHRGTQLPTCDWGLEEELGAETPIAHLAKARVLARLNTLAGIRLAARRQPSDAIITWLAGIRFSQHLAEGSSLVSMLTASTALRSALQAMNRMVGGNPVGAADKQKIQMVIRALPETAFDWGEAIRHEQSAMEVFVQQLYRASDPRAYYERLVGRAPQNFSVPTASDVAAFRAFMARAVAALRLSPDAARPTLLQLERDKQGLQILFRQMIPSLSRVNDVRAELGRERDLILQASQ
jgi:hypothetical protein